jgi:hypothetical protein
MLNSVWGGAFPSGSFTPRGAKLVSLFQQHEAPGSSRDAKVIALLTPVRA